MAERTKTGWVYIISNIGSFGKDIVKIGLTRRLEPEDRIRELGDASVPFLFDTHAMIYSEDAPALERALHGEFEPVRVNAENFRKEFFRASLDEVEAAVKRLAPAAGFFRDREAQEYQETLSRRKDCAFHGIRPAIPRASGRSFHEHPATSGVGLRGVPSSLIAPPVVKGIGGAEGCPREGPARPAPRPPRGWRCRARGRDRWATRGGGEGHFAASARVSRPFSAPDLRSDGPSRAMR